MSSMKTIKKNELMAMVGGLISVCNMHSPRSGKDIPNQFKLNFAHGDGFQSYNSLIGIRYNGEVYLTANHDYSSTTSKYCTEWLGYDTKTRKKKLENGEFIFIVAE